MSAVGKPQECDRPTKFPKKVEDPDALLARIDELKGHLDRSKAFLPAVPDTAVGTSSIGPVGYYANKGYVVWQSLGRPLTAEDIATRKDLGYWLNGSYIVWLAAILEDAGILSNSVRILKALPGASEVDVVRRLRNKLSHKLGRYDPSSADDKGLYTKLTERYTLDSVDIDDGSRFPIPIHKVIDPLTLGCKRYVKALTESQEAQS